MLKREVILADDVERIFGKRPWASRTEELLGLNAPATATEETTADAEAPIPVEGEEKTEEHPE